MFGETVTALQGRYVWGFRFIKAEINYHKWEVQNQLVNNVLQSKLSNLSTSRLCNSLTSEKHCPCTLSRAPMLSSHVLPESRTPSVLCARSSVDINCFICWRRKRTKRTTSNACLNHTHELSLVLLTVTSPVAL